MLGLFSKEKAYERKLKKASKKLMNMFVQSVDRRYSARDLLELDTPEAYKVLFERYEKKVPNQTTDREEKVELTELLIDRGETVVEHALTHIKGTAQYINQPLKVVAHFYSKEEMAALVAELLEGMDTEYERFPEKKEDLVLTAVEYVDDRLGKALLPFLADSNERIRFLAADALFTGGYSFASEPIVKRLAGEEDSIRVITRLVDGVAETDWTVKGYKAAVEENLPEGFAITRGGTIRRRGSQ